VYVEPTYVFSELTDYFVWLWVAYQWHCL